MKTRSGLASDATSVATRRSALCSCASWPTSTSFAVASPASAGSSGVSPRSVTSRPAVTRYAGASALVGTSLFDQAIRRRPPSFVCQ